MHWRKIAFLRDFVLFICLLMVAAFLSAITYAQPAQASVLVDDLVYESVQTGPPNYPRTILKQSGTTTSQVSGPSLPNEDHSPDVSPDGSKIAFIGSRPNADDPNSNSNVLMVMNSDGSGQTTLVTPYASPFESDMAPRWSPDGSKIAYIEQRSSGYAVVIRDADGSNRVALTSGTLVQNVSWFSDSNGDRLVYDVFDGGTGRTQLYIMDADGTNQHLLAGADTGFDEAFPTWSPDGNRIYFISDAWMVGRGLGVWYYESTNGFTSGSPTVQRLSSTDGPGNASWGGMRQVRVSADGNTLAYSRADFTGCNQIWTMSASSGATTKHTNTGNGSCTAQNFSPTFVSAAWSPKRIAVLGDSYSSGEGVPNFTSPSDSNNCHRSEKAYAEVLKNTPAGIILNDFVACSGATTGDIAVGKNGEGSQLSALSSDDDLVILTVGGNDIGFDAFAENCVKGDCYQSSQYNAAMSAISNDLPNNLDSLLDSISSLIGSQTRVLILGYPRLMPYAANEGVNCWYLDSDENYAVKNVQQGLNAAISSAVSRAGSSFEFVNADANLNNLRISPFAGHELCQSGEYFNGLVLPPNEKYSFHPNEDGQKAYAQLITDYLANNP